ncbi:methyltransferase [Lentzea sp. NPDC051208]|uniref:methyltransferase n=1 Tax=Lentzea sp. NPDC051208 TaxID=3154642 RepID=UPI00341CFD45
MLSDERRTYAGSELPGAVLLDEVVQYVFPMALRTAAVLGVADHLADGPMAVADLARLTGADESSLHRTLRLLATKGIFQEDVRGRFALTELAEPLRSSSPVSVRDGVIMITDETLWRSVGELPEAVRTGAPVFDRVFDMQFFEHFAQNPAAAAEFDKGMASFSAVEVQPVADMCALPTDGTIIDVGGGQGGLLQTVLRDNPGLSGILVDQEHVVTGHVLDTPEVAGRWSVEAGDFFDAVPAGDVYLIKRILHDWDDDRCARILANCRRAMRPGGRVLVVDAAIPPGNEPHHAKAIDVIMLTLLPGRERTTEEFAPLFAAAGLRLTSITSVPGTTMSIMEGVAA